MAADRPSADVVAANVINGVMFFACGLAALLAAAAAAACVHAIRAGEKGRWDQVGVTAPFALSSLAFGPRLIRRGLDLIRKRAQRETAI